MGSSLYIILAPLSVFLPSISIGINVNPIQILMVMLFCILVLRIFLVEKRVFMKKSVVVCILCASLLAFSVLFHAEEITFEYLRLIFNFFAFFVLLLFFLIEKNIPPFYYWVKVISISAVIALTFSLGTYLGYISSPSYRINIENLFYEGRRTASVVDSAIGLWLCVVAAYVVPGSPLRSLILQFFLLSVSTLLILLGGFTMMLICEAILLLAILMFDRLQSSHSRIVFYAFTFLFILLAISSTATFLAEIPGIERLSIRFQQINDENKSLFFRSLERQQEIEIIKNAPLFGEGWDLLKKYSIGSNDIGYLPLYGHCIYTALPARIGLLISLVLFASILNVMLRGSKVVLRKNICRETNEIFVSLLGIFVFLVASFTQNLAMTSMSFPVISIFIAYIMRNSHLLSPNNM